MTMKKTAQKSTTMMTMKKTAQKSGQSVKSFGLEAATVWHSNINFPFQLSEKFPLLWHDENGQETCVVAMHIYLFGGCTALCSGSATFVILHQRITPGRALTLAGEEYHRVPVYQYQWVPGVPRRPRPTVLPTSLMSFFLHIVYFRPGFHE